MRDYLVSPGVVINLPTTAASVLSRYLILMALVLAAFD